MLTFPNDKINLGLNITGKRPNGYHNLETVFYPTPIEDALEVNLLHKGNRKYYLHQASIGIAGEAENNLVMEVYKLLDGPFDLPPMDIRLLKYIPSGVGLGGGSADAAFILKLLNEKFNLDLSIESMEDYVSRLDTDCAFFIRDAPTYVEGTGSVFSSVSSSLKGFQFWLVESDIFVSTRDVFLQIKPYRSERPLEEIMQLPVEGWRSYMVNDFEESVFPQFPIIREIKGEMYRQSAVYVLMSGSGSSVYGIFEPNVSLSDIDFGKEALVYRGELVV